MSAFLILTIEKNWWGGYLTQQEDQVKLYTFQEFMLNGQKLFKIKKPNPAYRVENTIRMAIVGVSIAFFMIFCFVEII